MIEIILLTLSLEMSSSCGYKNPRIFVRLQNPPTWQIAKDWALGGETKNRRFQSIKTHTTYHTKNCKNTSGTKNNNHDIQS